MVSDMNSMRPLIPYVYREFPKMLYHATLGTKVVNDKEQQTALGEEWNEKPISKVEIAAVEVSPEPAITSAVVVEPPKRGRPRKEQHA